MRKRQKLQKHSCDIHAQDKQFQSVLAKNFSRGPLWITGKILKKSEATTFLVKLLDGQVIHCYADQLNHNSLDLIFHCNRMLTNSGYCQVLTLTNLIKRGLNTDTPPESGIHLHVFHPTIIDYCICTRREKCCMCINR